MYVCQYLNQRVRRIGEENRKSFKGVMMMVILVSENQHGIYDVIKETSYHYQSKNTMSGS